MADPYTKFEVFSLSRSGDISRGVKFRPRPFQERFFIGKVGLYSELFVESRRL